MTISLYFWLVQKTEISQREELDFFLEIDFYMSKTLPQHGACVRCQQLSYFNEDNFDPLWSKLLQATTSTGQF